MKPLDSPASARKRQRRRADLDVAEAGPVRLTLFRRKCPPPEKRLAWNRTQRADLVPYLPHSSRYKNTFATIRFTAIVHPKVDKLWRQCDDWSTMVVPAPVGRDHRGFSLSRDNIDLQ